MSALRADHLTVEIQATLHAPTPDPDSPPSGGAPLQDAWLEHLDWIRRLAVRLASDEPAAEDLVQQTAMAALREPPSGTPGRIRGWLQAVLHNAARAQWRGDRHRRARETAHFEAHEHAFFTPAATRERLDLQAAVVGAVGALDEPYRVVIVLRYFDELPVPLIAERLGVPVRTVETRLYRGRVKLRAALDGEHGPRAAWSVAALAAWDLPLGVAPGTVTASTIKTGAFLMGLKSVLALVVVAAAVLFGVQRLGRGGEPHELARQATVDGVDVGAQVERDVASASETGGGQEAQLDLVPIAGSHAARVADDAAPLANTAECHVIGKVVDRAGKPLAGVVVQLGAYKVWRNGVSVPELPGKGRLVGFVRQTEPDGTFRLDVPVPKAAAVYCTITPDHFHRTWRMTFERGLKDARPLTPGVHDLGTIILEDAGAIFGRVVDQGGEPVVDVRVYARRKGGEGSSEHGTTDSHGAFYLGHAPTGSCEVRVITAPGEAQAGTGVVVVASHEAGPVEVVLTAAATISGVVRDESGAPIERARIWAGWRAADGRSSGSESALSGPNGHFELLLTHSGPHPLSATHSRYVAWGDKRSRTDLVEAGTDDVEIVMVALPKLTILVVDHASGDPIESFGYTFEQGESIATMLSKGVPMWPRPDRQLRTPVHHEGGRLEIAGREGDDHLNVFADGFALWTRPIKYDEPGDPLQTVRMLRGKTVMGRFLRDGIPVPFADVEIVGGTTRRSLGLGVPTPTGEPVGEFSRTALALFSPRVKTLRWTQTDAEGRFELAGLARGLHRLQLATEGQPVTVVYPLQLKKRISDIGDISATTTGSINGRVLVPEGVDAEGLRVYLDLSAERVMQLTDADGGFLFEDVTPGEHGVTLVRSAGRLEHMPMVPVIVKDGGATEVTIDATGQRFVAVKLVVLIDGDPASGSRVTVRQADVTNSSSVSLGECDGDGRVEGIVPAWGKAVVHVRLVGVTLPKALWSHIFLSRDQPPGRPLVATVRFDFAELTLDLPEGVEFPRSGSFLLRFDPQSGAFGDGQVRIQFADGQPLPEFAAVARVEGNTLILSHVPPVTGDALIQLTETVGPQKWIPTGKHSKRLGWPSYYETTIQLSAVPGGRSRIRLPRQ